jgi:predicted O-methyltransferase YrrM
MHEIKKRTELCKLFNKLNYEFGAEIGVGEGEFSAEIASACPGLTLFSIDPWKEYLDPNAKKKYNFKYQKFQDKRRAKAVLLLGQYPNCTIIEKSSMEAVREFKDSSLDFVFIDANHGFNYVMSDIIFWSMKVKSGGIVACHDYHWFKGPHVREAVDVYLKCHNIFPYYVTQERLPTAFWINP